MTQSLFSIPQYSGGLATSAVPAADSTGLRRHAVEFESLLLNNILEKLQHAYGSVPGDQPADAAHDSESTLATQALSMALAKAGGVGIAKMILEYVPENGKSNSVGPK